MNILDIILSVVIVAALSIAILAGASKLSNDAQVLRDAYANRDYYILQLMD